jgi:truncated hemoglobin YjbI
VGCLEAFTMPVVAIAPPAVSLLEELGGPVSIERIVDAFTEAVLSDPLLGRAFAGVDPAILRRSQTAFVVEALGGQGGQAPSHPPVRLDGAQFAAFALHFCDTLVRLRLPASLRERVVTAVAARALHL